MLAAGPMLVIDEIPDSNPTKKVAQAYIAAYEKQFGQQARDVRRQHVGRRHPARSARFRPRSRPASRAPRRSASRCATRSRRSARSSARQGVFNMSADQSQRHGRARARAGHRARTASSGCSPSDVGDPPLPSRSSPRARSPAASMRLTGILLAAGRGARFGGAKLLAPLPSASHGVGAGRRSASRPCLHLLAALADVVAVVRPGDSMLASTRCARPARASSSARARTTAWARASRAAWPRQPRRRRLGRRARRHAVDRAGDDRRGRRRAARRRRHRRARRIAASAAIRSGFAPAHYAAAGGARRRRGRAGRSSPRTRRRCS